jgi:hypothetical protein
MSSCERRPYLGRCDPSRHTILLDDVLAFSDEATHSSAVLSSYQVPGESDHCKTHIDGAETVREDSRTSWNPSRFVRHEEGYN